MDYTNNKPVVTIVVPVYNVEGDLNRCVESLVGQTLHDIQIVLVDDGSTDTSGQMCDAWAKRDNRIRVVHKQNGGLSSARNAGIEVADGAFLGFVDSDDYVEPNMYEKLLAAFTDERVSITTCGRYVHMSDFVKEDFIAGDCRRFPSIDAMKEVLSGGVIDVAAWDKLYRRELFSMIRYPEGRISEDAAIIMQLLYECEDVVHVGESFYHYVFRAGSISKSVYSHKKFDVMRNCVEIKSWLAEKRPELVVYGGSYSCVQMAAMIEDMLNTPGARKEWPTDYSSYWELFRTAYKDYKAVGGHEKKELARIKATRWHFYRLFWLARQARNRVRRGGWID